MLRFLGLILGCALLVDGTASAQERRVTDALTREVIQPASANEALADAPSIQTQNIDPAAGIDRGSVQVGAVKVTGLSQLSQGDFVDIAESYAGRSLDVAGLQVLARAVADRARSRGYIFATAVVPPQELEIGIVQVLLDEGAIDEVRLQGATNPRVRDLLMSLVGTAVRKRDIETLLLLANDVPGIVIQQTRFVRENGRGILIVDVFADNARGTVRIDNAGSDAFGPVRARLEVEFNGIIDADDQLVTFTQATPLQVRELVFGSARYSNIVSRSGLQLSVNAGAGRTRNSDGETGRISKGRSHFASVALTAPLIRSNTGSLWVSADLGYLGVRQTFGNGLILEDDIASVTVSGWGNVRTGPGRIQAGVSITRGIGILGSTRAGDVAASRIDGSGRFTKANLWANWSGKLGGGYAIRLATTGQIASRPLLSSQEIGLGGPNYARGYDFSERFGDQGVMGVAELRRGFERRVGPLDWAQLYGFVDGGYIDNLRDGFGGGTLVSGGGGVRAGVIGTEIGIEIAKPINAARFDSKDRSPKVNLTIGYRF